MKVYNTLTRKKEELVEIEPGHIGMYVCGPTVYNHIHVGNARTFVSFDVIRRHLIESGYDVTFVSNLTDVDDKIINRANEEGRSAAEVADEYSKAFIDAMDALGVMSPTIRPRATEEIDSMIEIIQILIDKNYAYEEQGDVYFSVRFDSDYGKLSGRSIDEMIAGTRIESDPKKHDSADFALWKAAKPGEPSWESPWGNGRPGWHIECSSMSAKYLGQPFDIHGGGVDLVFPHHENEIAQSECCHSKKFCNYWMHGGMLMINSEKMSKSEGNFLLLKDVLEQVDAKVLRMLMLQTHYRSPLDYSVERIEEATISLERITNCLRNIAWDIEQRSGKIAKTDEEVMAFKQLVEETKTSFIEAMDDDFNTASALGAIFKLVGETNAFIADGLSSEAEIEAANLAHDMVVYLMGRFGIDLVEDANESDKWPDAILEIAVEYADYLGQDKTRAADELLNRRDQARKEKDFQIADTIRDSLSELGFIVEDTPSGARLIYQA